MHYLIYKITNNVNNIIYVGKHMTSDKADDYMGSGLRLKEAIESFGIEHFTKEILFECESEEAMNQKEAEIVDEVFVARLDTYNLNTGGAGGWYSCNKRGLNRPTAFFNRLKSDPVYAEYYHNKLSESLKYYHATRSIESANEIGQKIRNALLLYYSSHPAIWTNRKHTTESKVAIGRKNAIHQLGEGNSVYGKVWIHNLSLKQCMMINPEELSKYQAEGWIKGRRMKF